MEDEISEKMADKAHEVWARWMKYLFSKCVMNPDGSATIPGQFVGRWGRQMETAYADLPESEKKSDRDIAAEYLEVSGIELKADAFDKLERYWAAGPANVYNNTIKEIYDEMEIAVKKARNHG
jgi:hypothetical protein